MKTECFRIPAAHPVFAGHFPGAPLVPGSVLLELVLAAWGAPFERVPEVKYLAPVLPDDTVVVRFTPVDGSDRFRFDCQVEGRQVCCGLLLARSDSS